MKQKHTTAPTTEVKEGQHTPDKKIEVAIIELSKTLDQDWIDELAKEEKHEIIRHYRVQILFSARLKEEKKAIEEANRELLEALKDISEWDKRHEAIIGTSIINKVNAAIRKHNK